MNRRAMKKLGFSLPLAPSLLKDWGGPDDRFGPSAITVTPAPPIASRRSRGRPVDTLQLLSEAVDLGDHEHAADLLQRFFDENPGCSRPEWIAANVEFLRTGRDLGLGRLYADREFIHPISNEFILVLPCGALRDGRREVKLSMLYGTAIPRPAPVRVRAAATAVFGLPTEPYPTIIAYWLKRAAGGLGGERAEGFVTPDQFEFEILPGSSPLNDMAEQRRRIEVGAPLLDEIFAADTAAFLRSYLARGITRLQLQEYERHDIGHGTGLGLHLKLPHLATYQLRAMEEARADWVAFSLTRQVEDHLLPEVVASNFCTRFLVDSQRFGNRRDTDVNVALMTLDHALADAAMYITDDGKLALSVVSERGLARAVERAARFGWELTQRELQLGSVDEIQALYQYVVAPGTRELFEEIVRKKIVFTELT